jgi:hypothetical protein
MKHLLLCLLSVLLLCPVSSLAMSRKAKYVITFHVQGDEMASPRSIFRQAIPGQEHPVIFEKVPMFSHMQVAAIHSFPADDGQTLGLTLRLDFRGSNALGMVTRTRPGQLLLAMINGQPVDYVMIDGPISDGMITIWRGVPQECVDELAKKYPPISKMVSMSEGHDDMVPTTKGEKRDALTKSRKEDAAAKKAAEEGEKPNPLDLAVPAKPVPLPQQ